MCVSVLVWMSRNCKLQLGPQCPNKSFVYSFSTYYSNIFSTRPSILKLAYYYNRISSYTLCSWVCSLFLLVVEATNVGRMMVLAAAEGTQIHQTWRIGVKFWRWRTIQLAEGATRLRRVEWIDSSLASKLSSRVTAGYRTAEWIRTKQVRSSVTTQLKMVMLACYPALFDTVWLRVSFRLLLLLLMVMLSPLLVCLC